MSARRKTGKVIPIGARTDRMLRDVRGLLEKVEASGDSRTRFGTRLALVVVDEMVALREERDVSGADLTNMHRELVRFAGLCARAFLGRNEAIGLLVDGFNFERPERRRK